MNDSPEDRELRNLFAELRQEDAARAPNFERMMAGARTDPAPRRRWPWAIPVLAAAALAGVMMGRPDLDAEAQFERAVQSLSSGPARAAWQSPTDRLLEVPGVEFMRTVPRIQVPSWPGDVGGVPPRSQS